MIVKVEKPGRDILLWANNVIANMVTLNEHPNLYVNTSITKNLISPTPWEKYFMYL